MHLILYSKTLKTCKLLGSLFPIICCSSKSTKNTFFRNFVILNINVANSVTAEKLMATTNGTKGQENEGRSSHIQHGGSFWKSREQKYNYTESKVSVEYKSPVGLYQRALEKSLYKNIWDQIL